MVKEHRAIGHFRWRICDPRKEFGLLVHWKSGVKSLPAKIVADLDPSKRVNLSNSVLRESPKFINLGLPTFDAMGKQNIDSVTSTRDKSSKITQRDNFRADRLGYTHDFERVKKKDSIQ